MHFDNKKKDNLILGEGLRQGLDDTTLATEVKYPINFSQPDIVYYVYTIMEATVP